MLGRLFGAVLACLTTFIRLQDKNSVYAGPMDVVRQIVKKDGILGLYAGMEATFWRQVGIL